MNGGKSQIFSEIGPTQDIESKRKICEKLPTYHLTIHPHPNKVRLLQLSLGEVDAISWQQKSVRIFTVILSFNAVSIQ